MNGLFAEMSEANIKGGRASIAPEKLLRAILLQVLYSVRSERQLMEQVTLIQAWASHKSFVRKDDDQNNGDDFKGSKRGNDTHQYKTDLDSRLYRKGNNTAVGCAVSAIPSAITATA